MATKEKTAERGWEVVSDEEGEPWKPTKEGDAIIGRYEGFTTAVDPVGLDGQPREFKIFHVRCEDGGLRSVYSTYKLDKAFETVAVNDDVSLTFMGKINIGNAQTMNDFKVLKRSNQ